MTNIGLFLCLFLIYRINDTNGLLLKHLTPRPGGIIDSLIRPKEQPGGFQLGSHLGGGISFGLGSFGFNFGFNKQYVPGGVNVPPKEPHIPDGETGYPDVPGVKPGYPDSNPYVPGVKPGYPNGNPYVPGVKPGYPNGNPYVPGGKPDYPEDNPYIPRPKPVKPSKPSMTWEDEEDEKVPHYPLSKEKDYSKPESFEDNKKDYPKPGSYEDTSSPKREDKDSRPDWEDIGEVYEKDPKAENYMDKDFIGDGLIQPRLNKKRNKRFIESKIYHVPLLFRSNAKPNQVKIHNSLNSLEKVGLKK